jgi:hypothetical protein
MENRTLAFFPRSLKTLCICYILTILLGYGVSLLKVYDHSNGFNLSETATRYRGDPDPDAMMPPQSYASLLSVAHVHSFSQPFMLALLGLIFVFSTHSQGLKSALILSAFVGSFISNLTPWLIRYLSAEAVYLYPLSQIMVAVGLLGMAFLSLKQLACRARS